MTSYLESSQNHFLWVLISMFYLCDEPLHWLLIIYFYVLSYFTRFKLVMDFAILEYDWSLTLVELVYSIVLNDDLKEVDLV